MKILIDTNVILDIFLKREPFLNNSLKALKLASKYGDTLFFSAGSVADCFYMINKHLHSKDESLLKIVTLGKLIKFASVDNYCIFNALQLNFNDFEDAIVDSIASNIKADVILTRNVKDFINSKNKIMTPAEFIEMNR